LTVNVWPPAVMAPVRGVVLVFAATLNEIVPLPDPLAVPVTLIQAALLVALQAHPAAAVIDSEPLPPEAGMVCDVGERTYEHDVVAAACVTETVWPAIMIVPVRCVVAVLGATLNVTLPFPLPPVVPVSVIQLALL
jgi:hypothetical protein